jgi:uncharacterized protein YkwD
MPQRFARFWRAPLAFLSLAFLAGAACASAPTATRTTATRTTSGRTPRGSSPAPITGALINTSDAADDVLIRTNAARRAAGLSGLMRSVNLMSAAQLQADQMAKTGTMAHEVPGTAYPTLKSRLAAVSYEMRAAGENVAQGQRNAAEAVSMWMSSPGHRANILSSDYTEIGTGVALGRNGRLYWAQVFGRPLRPSSARRATP